MSDQPHDDAGPMADEPMPPTGAPASGGPPGGGAPQGAGQDSPEKDPEDWTTGDEPMTGPQRSYLQTLARQAGEDLPEDLTKAQASELIDRLQEQTGRGR